MITKTRESLALIILLTLAIQSAHSKPPLKPAPIDPNTIPVATDPCSYEADILKWIEASPVDANDPNSPPMTILSSINGWNMRGWATDLGIVLTSPGGGASASIIRTPTDASITKATSGPILVDPNDRSKGYNQEFLWSWTPPGIGTYYLEFRLSTIEKDQWAPEVRTIVVFYYPHDIPILWTEDNPILLSSEVKKAQYIWQVAKTNAMKWPSQYRHPTKPARFEK